MRNHADTLSSLQKNLDEFTVITHSDDYIDYKTCESMDIPVAVIPNAIDFNEFKDQGFSFRDKYQIPRDKKLVLNVSNFFPGKGQEHLHHMLQQLHAKQKDLFACFISSRVNFTMAENLKRRHDMILRRSKFPSKSLRDIPREDTIQAFFEADVFAFPSQTEVAPLVILECMAAGLPYASLNVGNVPSLTGGLVAESKQIKQGKLQYSTPVYESFTNNLNRILSDDELHRKLSSDGKQRILDIHDWSKVKEQYRNVFES
jgi:glycosyltransferase involved in cell wall biosynthesis